MAMRVISIWTTMVVLALLGGSVAAETKLRIATVMGERDPGGQALNRWAAEVRKATKGEVTIQLFFGAMGAEDRDLVRKLTLSQLDGVLVSSAGLSLLESNVLAFELPGLFDSVAKLGKARNALMPALTQLLAKKELKLLGIIDGGMVRWMSKTKPIKNPADLASAKVLGWRDDPFLQAELAKLVYKPVAGYPAEVAIFLKKGTIDTLTSSALAASRFGYAGEIGQVTDLVVHIETGALVVQTASFAKLSASARKVVEDSASKLTTSLSELNRTADDKAFRALIKRAKLVPLTAAEKTEWGRTYKSIREVLEKNLITSLPEVEKL